MSARSPSDRRVMRDCHTGQDGTDGADFLAGSGLMPFISAEILSRSSRQPSGQKPRRRADRKAELNVRSPSFSHDLLVTPHKKVFFRPDSSRPRNETPAFLDSLQVARPVRLMNPATPSNRRKHGWSENQRRRTRLASHHRHVTAWQPDVTQESIDFVYEDSLRRMRGFLIGLAISVVLWSALSSGLWVGLTFIGVSS